MINTLKYLKSVILLLTCLVFIVFQVVILNYDSTQGREYEKMTYKIKELEIENAVLAQKVASESSMLAISGKAEALGFIPKKSVLSLYGPLPLAAVANRL